ncbi:DNA repair protein RAD51 homolog 4-like [Mizuhopecten yessoensis]|uniref:DNA repair protein RAD51 homolog 4-like n=1 Tax=Mizuhopecten yessoensis TaxID=6573 RepID=UPI000B4574D0|nr:DNA repair protein RAD51 homolog 4-like [Mizuhopecten yessoensis]
MSALKIGTCPTLTESIHSRLREAGIKTVTDLIVADVEMLSQKSEIPYKELLALRRVLLAQTSSFPVSGADMYETAMVSTSILTTGCTRVDDLLDGGLYTGEVTEIAGEIAAGKTQFCMTCASSVMCGARQNVFFIDTCGALSVERVLQIAEHSGQEIEESTFQRMRCHQAFDIFSLLSELENLRCLILQQTDGFYSNLKLLIVDNVASVIYPVLGGQQMDGHGLMVTLSRKLKQLAVECSIAVLITNNLVGGDWDRSRSAALGKTWSHVPHTRIVISTSNGQRQISLVKSSKTQTNMSVSCVITEAGVRDSTDHG